MNIKFNEKACKAVICLIAAAALILGAIFASQTGSNARPIGKMPSPIDSAAVFFDSYRAGEYDALDKYIYGYETLGLSGGAGSQYGEKMLKCLGSELEYEFVGEPVVDGDHAKVKVKLSYFSIPDSAARLKEIFNEEIIITMRENSEGVDLNVHDDNYYNMIVLPSLDIAVDKLVEQRDEYVRSRTIDLEMIYSGNGWKIVPDDKLKRVLLGGLD